MTKLSANRTFCPFIDRIFGSCPKSERSVRYTTDDGTERTRRIDLDKRDCFIREARQFAPRERAVVREAERASAVDVPREGRKGAMPCTRPPLSTR